MRRFDDQVVSPVNAGGYNKGDPVDGATITIYHEATLVAATLYSDENLTPLANPLTTDSNGRFAFFVQDGRYDIKVFKTSVVDYTHTAVAITDARAIVEVTLNDEVWYGILNAYYDRNAGNWKRRDTSKDAWGIEGKRSDVGPTLRKAASGANPISAWALVGRLGTPVGAVVPYAGIGAPTGWLLCDGIAVSRTTYADLFTTITIARAGATTNGSAVVTGLSQTSDLRVGMALTGAGIPASTTILTIDSGSQITMSANATATGTPTITFYPYGAGDQSTTFNVPDLRSRIPIGRGQGSGLSDRRAGQSGGEETHALTTGEMPAHTHNIDVSATGANASVISKAPQPSGGTASTLSAGGGGAHENMPPFVVLTYIIKT